MAGNLSNYAESKILELSVGKTAWAKPDLYCALFTSPPSDVGGGTEVPTVSSGVVTGYRRIKISEAESVLYGTFSAVTGTSLTTTGLTDSAWVGGVVTILTATTGAGSTGTVTANSTTGFTVTSWSPTATPTGTGIFVVKKAAKTVWGDASDGMIKNNNATYKATLPYAGTWNASTNTPTLADGTGTTGTTYLVTTAGTSLSQTFAQGDFIQYSGGTWNKLTTPPYSIASDATNGGRIEFPNALAGWGTVVSVGLMDAETGGELIWHGSLTATKTVLTGESVAFATSDLVLSLD